MEEKEKIIYKYFVRHINSNIDTIYYRIGNQWLIVRSYDKVRTTELNEIFTLILNYTKGFTKQKSGQNKYFNCLSAFVV